jgi:hypothetical protein
MLQDHAGRQNSGTAVAMIIPNTLLLRAQRCCAIVLLCAVAVTLMSTARAGEREDEIAASADTPDAIKHGELVFHGNYCGLGNRKGAAPIDALDEACMHHDACTPTGKIQSCACNARLAEEAAAVATDPRQTPELKALASLTATAAGAGSVICAPGALLAPERAATVAPVPSNAPASPAAPMPSNAPVSSVASMPVSAAEPTANAPAPEPAAPVPVSEPLPLTPAATVHAPLPLSPPIAADRPIDTRP